MKIPKLVKEGAYAYLYGSLQHHHFVMYTEFRILFWANIKNHYSKYQNTGPLAKHRRKYRDRN